MRSQLRCARRALSQRQLLRETSLTVVSFVIVVVALGGCLHGIDVETRTSSKHEGESGSGKWCGGMLVSVDCDKERVG